MLNNVATVDIVGELPTQVGDEVDVQACVEGPLGECPNTRDIKIKNCGQFNVYYLVATNACPEAYCFGM